MSFFSGRITCTRFRVTGRAVRQFGEEHVEALAKHAIGKRRVATADGSAVGWIGGDHILDTRFDLAKNIINDCLQFTLRIDTQKVPSDLLRAYTQEELEALHDDPSRPPGVKVKREARARARQRLETEAADGRYLRRVAVPMMWDSQSGELLVGTTGISALDRVLPMFRETFERGLEMLSAGVQAFQQAEAREQSRRVDDAQPSAFISGRDGSVVWVPEEDNRDFLGNEFLLWLWHHLENDSDEVKLIDNSKVTAMMSRSLALECPLGQTGKQSLLSEGPGRLPEAHRALQAGKLPRKAGLTLVRHDQQYELTLHAESLAISGAKLPVPEALEERARHEERVTQIRHLLETLDLLYGAFGEIRLGDGWGKELKKIRHWLKEAE